MVTLQFVSFLYGQDRSNITGHVLDKETKLPIQGATVWLEGSSNRTSTGSKGAFELNVAKGKGRLVFTSLGFDTIYQKIASVVTKEYVIYLSRSHKHLDEVLVSTGYEKYDQRKSTGAVEVIDQKQINRTSGTDIMGRLEGITSGLYFNKATSESSSSLIGRPPKHNVFLQGISTLRGSSLTANQPLIILDNFPYEGDLNSINPNDVESISILKDAAAAAIWGAKAGNGVIVITTKRVGADERLRIEVSSNMQVHDKPDIFARPIISSSDLIDIEMDLYSKGFYTSKYNGRTKPSLPPVVELLYQHDNGLLTEDELDVGINQYRNQDVRDGMLKYMSRNSILQQYSLRISGGGKKHKVGLSLGYDHSLATRISDKSGRLTGKLDNNLRLTDRLEMAIGLRWNLNRLVHANGSEFYSDNGFRYPYVTIADAEGRALPIPWDYSMSYLETAGEGRLLDWHFRPLDEARNATHMNHSNEIMADFRIQYDLLDYLRLSVDYRYGQSDSQAEVLRTQDTYYMRNLINRGTELQEDNIVYHHPLGGIKSIQAQKAKNHWGRVQLNLIKEFGSKYQLRAIAGIDVSDGSVEGSGFSMYGYDDERGIFATQVDYYKQYPIFDNLATYGTVGSPISPYTFNVNRSVSLYANGSFTFDRRHIFSSSIRRDASNVFGLETNNKWTPLWSTGYAYQLHEESFYKISWMPHFKFRATYGVSGNVDNSMSSLVTVSYVNNPIAWALSLPSATVNRLPNPSLRWEKVKQFNLGLDLTLGKSARVRSTVDYYYKLTDDLLYDVPIDPSMGRSSAVRNVANTQTKGWNVNLTTINLLQPIEWRTQLNFAYNNSWIINTYRDYTTPTRYVLGGTISEIPQTMVFGLYSYQWGGLDPDTGQPRGIVNGEKSTDYRTIMSAATTFEDLHFHGSSRPLYFGSLRNDIRFRSWTFSFNMSYEFDYFFKRNGLDYGNLLDKGDGHADYYQRWQKPGDEQRTHVPGFVYPLVSSANVFYQSSAVLAERGDHIRLRDIRLDFTDRIKLQHRDMGIQVFGMVNNLGILWKSTSLSIDPQYRGNIPPPRFYTLGIKLNY